MAHDQILSVKPPCRATPAAFEWVHPFIDATEEDQVKFAAALSARDATKVITACVKAAEHGRYVSHRGLACLYAQADPDEYLEGAQDDEIRLMTTPRALARIRADRGMHEYMTLAEREAADAAAQAEAIEADKAAAQAIQPFVAMDEEEREFRLSGCTPAELDFLFSAVRRCIEEVGPRKQLAELRALIRATRAWKRV